MREQLEATGLTKENLKFTDEAITHIIRHYTHEAGVRNLDREIANVCRKVARKVVAEGKSFSGRGHAGERQRLSRHHEVPRLSRREEK